MEMDKIFSQKIEQVADFKFNEDVAQVFDDMVSRSVPFYNEIHRIILDFSNYFLPKSGGVVYDLGCSTGTTISLLSKHLDGLNKSCHFVGIDNSEPMIKKCNQKLSETGVKSAEVFCTDIGSFKFDRPADMIIMNYTLQFIPHEDRQQILKNIYIALRPGGVLILSEKICTDESSFHELITDLYYDFKKRNGYSSLEISQKREALENVMRPITPKEQIKMLNESGFEKCEMIFRWYNFASYIGIK